MDRALVEGLLRALQDVAVIRKDLVRFASASCPMSSLAMLGVLERTGEIRVGRLAEVLHVDISVASRQLAQLESTGQVSREPDPDDGRAHLVSLTSAGRVELESVKAGVADRFDQALAEWSESEVAALTGRLERLRLDLQPALGSVPPWRDLGELRSVEGGAGVGGVGGVAGVGGVGERVSASSG